MPAWAFEVFHWAALLPLAAVLVRRGSRWRWWLAAAFAVSWPADTVAEWLLPGERWIVSATYPVTQAGLLYALLAPRRAAMALLAVTGAVALLAAHTWAWTGPDAALRLTIAVSVVGLVRRRSDLGAIRTGLLVYFGAGALCWIWLPFVSRDLVVWPWLGYQGCRLIGLGYVTWGIGHEAASWPPADPVAGARWRCTGDSGGSSRVH